MSQNRDYYDQDNGPWTIETHPISDLIDPKLITENRVIQILHEYFDSPDIIISRETRLEEDLYADSIDWMKLLLIFSREFDFPETGDDDGFSLETIGDIIDGVIALKSK